MTERIYYEDAYCREFEAVVASCTQNNKRYEIVLDRTAFYPEGGGQPGDRGILSVGGSPAASVTDTHERDGDVVHYCDRPLETGTKVTGRINWNFRLDMMQNHSGEHIVSGLIHRKYGYENVGFHMGSDFITIDLSGELTMDQLKEIELQANEVVWNNVPTQIRVCSEEEAEKIEYRSKKPLHGEIRIVTFPGADVCACCGTHIARTGEIGLIRIYSAVRFRGGVRVELLCGRRALEHDRVLCDQNQEVAVEISAKPHETAAAVSKVIQTGKEEAFQYHELLRRIDRERARRLKNRGNVLLFIEDKNMDAVGKTAAAVMETCGGLCAVFSGTDREGYNYAVGLQGGDCGEFVRSMNQALSGRGGGKPFFAQGRAAAGRKQILEWFHGRDGGFLEEDQPF